MDRFKNKYRIASARAPFWDYAWNAAYFVTICTKNREHWFGKITDGVMDLSDIGEIVQSEWFKTFEMRPDMNLWMGEYVVMPNHFHAIIGIGENEYNTQRDMQRNTQRRDAMHCVYHRYHRYHRYRPPHGSQKPIRPPIQKFGIHYSGV